MNKKLNDLLVLDEKIGNFLYDNSDLSIKELNDKFKKMGFIDKALKMIQELSNKSVLELLKRSKYINNYIDLKKFIRCYPLNKSYLRKNKDMYFDEYQKLKNTCIYLCSISNDYNEFQEYMDALDVDNVEYYLLSNMSNEQLYKISQETTDWMQKMYYF